jgi:hypothetical protein
MRCTPLPAAPGLLKLPQSPGPVACCPAPFHPPCPSFLPHCSGVGGMSSASHDFVMAAMEAVQQPPDAGEEAAGRVQAQTLTHPDDRTGQQHQQRRESLLACACLSTIRRCPSAAQAPTDDPSSPAAAGSAGQRPAGKLQKAYEFAVDVAAGPPDSIFRWALVGAPAWSGGAVMG